MSSGPGGALRIVLAFANALAALGTPAAIQAQATPTDAAAPQAVSDESVPTDSPTKAEPAVSTEAAPAPIALELHWTDACDDGAPALGVQDGAQPCAPSPSSPNAQTEHDACLSPETLAHAVGDRIERPLALNADRPALRVRVEVAGRDGGFDVSVITSAPDEEDVGRRELTIEGDCSALVAPLSLVIGLSAVDALAQAKAVPPDETADSFTDTPPEDTPPQDAPPESRAPDPKPTPVTPPSRVPSPGPPSEATAPPRPVRYALWLDLGAGVLGGLMPAATPAGGVGVALERSGSPGRAVTGELMLHGIAPSSVERDGVRAEVSGLGASLVGCARLVGERARLDVCTGLWLSSIDVDVADDHGLAVSASPGLLPAADGRLGLRVPLGRGWSLFARTLVLVPFTSGPVSIRFSEPSPASQATSAQATSGTELGEPPFFNAEPRPLPAPATSTGGTGRSWEVELYRPPQLAGALLAGIAFSLL